MTELFPGESLERDAVVRLNGSAGVVEVPVKVLAFGETPKHFRVRWLKKAYRYNPGQVSLVPKGALRFL